MSYISSVFNPQQRSRIAPVTSEDQFPTWERSLEEKYVQTLVTNTFGQTFYTNRRDLIAQAAQIHDSMLAKDPEFAAKALVYARNKGFMRSQPVYGLVKLSSVDRKLFERIFPEVIRIPNDLFDFMTILKALGRGKGGRCIKRAGGEWLESRLSEYWAIKYGASKPGQFSLRDLFRVFHPKMERSELVAYVQGANDVNLDALPQVKAFEALKRAATAEEKIAAIAEGRLPHEQATPFAGKDKAVWDAIVPNMPLFALLRHLATLERHGVLDSYREHMEGLFANEKVISKAKILPYRFLDAAAHVKSSWATDALRDAVELSFGNLPKLDGRTVVMLDVSGSMKWVQSGKYQLAAAIFGVALLKKVREGRFLLFDTNVYEAKISTRDSTLSQAESVCSIGGGGTASGLPFRAILRERYKADNIVMITDEQQNRLRPAIDVLDEYKRKVKRDVKTFVINISPYSGGHMFPDERNTYYVYGWSPAVLTFVSMAANGWGSMIGAIRGDRV